MKISLDEINDADWNILLEEICNKKHPLRELELNWQLSGDGPVESGFVELANAIGTHTTLINFSISFNNTLADKKLSIIFKALKDNRSIKYLYIHAACFDKETADGFASALMNNQTLVSLDIEAWSEVDNGNHE
jgi:hypothetical protein